MTDDLVRGEAWLKLASSCESWTTAGDDGDASPEPRVVPAAEILRPTTQVILVFGAADPMPSLLPKGVWYQIAYQFTGDELALEIGKIESGKSAKRNTASINCLVHERWLDDFSASIDGRRAMTTGVFHLPSELRAIAAKAFHYELTGAACVAYRTAKGLELLCETVQLSLHDKLIPLHAGSGLSASDMQRLFAAKQMLAEQFNKKLTLDGISRACGLNRAKLTRGFRAVFGISIAEALSEERLVCASVLLQTTDKPVSNIGYDAGYLNNASFTRAFARRFGVCPSEFRLRQLSTGNGGLRHNLAA